MKTAHNHLQLILLLALLSSVTPLAIDAYLPAMPNMAVFFNVSITNIEITISIYLFFFALGQFIGGILSDRLGRKNTAMLGLFGFSISSFALFFVTSLEMLYLLRAFQAFLGAMAVVNTGAIVRDLFKGKEAAKVFSTIASIMMIAPMLAPSLGSLVISFYTWNYIFLFLGFYSFFVFLLIYFKLPTTGEKSSTKILQAYSNVLKHTKARAYILSVSFAFSGMFIFIQKSPFIYMEYFGITEDIFPFFFGANILMMIVFTRYNIKLIKNIEPKQILKYGILLQILSGFVLCIISFNANVYAVLVFLMLYIGSLGFIFGNAMALALDFFKKDTGVANAVIGISEFTIGGIIGFLVSLVPASNLSPIFMMMTVTALLSYFSLKR